MERKYLKVPEIAAMEADDDIKIKGPVDEETIKKLEAVDIISITFEG